MQTTNFDIQGVTCGDCIGKVQRALSKLDGISQVDVSLRLCRSTLLEWRRYKSNQ